MHEASTQLVGLLFLVMPLIAIQWNLAGAANRRPNLLAPGTTGSRWRLEIYSNDGDVVSSLVDPADVPFPVKRVRSAKGEQARFAPETSWALPRVELDVEVSDPFADDSLSGLLGSEHQVRFVTGNEAVIDTRLMRLRIKAFRFG